MDSEIELKYSNVYSKNHPMFKKDEDEENEGEIRNWSWWSKNEPEILARMRNELPETFNRLYNEEFKNNG